MEKKSNNGIVIILMSVVIVALTVLCVLFVTGTIDLKSNNTVLNDTVQNDTDNENKDAADENTDNESIKTGESNSTFGGEYVYNLSTGAKVYTDFTEEGALYYKRVEADNSISTYGYGIYIIKGNTLFTKHVFGIDVNNGSIVKTVTPEESYKINNETIEYDASGTSGSNRLEEKISDECNISKEVTNYLYSISKKNEYGTNFIYE